MVGLLAGMWWLDGKRMIQVRRVKNLVGELMPANEPQLAGRNCWWVGGSVCWQSSVE